MELECKDPLSLYKEHVLRRTYDETRSVFEFIDPEYFFDVLKSRKAAQTAVDVLSSVGLLEHFPEHLREELLQTSIFTELADYVANTPCQPRDFDAEQPLGPAVDCNLPPAQSDQ